MKKYKWLLILANLLILLFLFNNSIFKKERMLANGQLILLELAPVDPRSLMQGDYMNLRYAISQEVRNDSTPKRGFVVVKLDSNRVAQRVRIQKEKTPLLDNEYLIEYTLKGWFNLNIGAESYFFQEGQGDKYEKAKYGGVTVDANGNSLLTGLYDETFQKIE